MSAAEPAGEPFAEELDAVAAELQKVVEARESKVKSLAALALVYHLKRRWIWVSR